MIASDLEPEESSQVKRNDISALHSELIQQMKIGNDQVANSLKRGNTHFLNDSSADIDVGDKELSHHTIFIPYCTGMRQSPVYNEAYSYMAQQLGRNASMKEIHSEQKLGNYI